MAEPESLRDRAIQRGISVQRFNRGLLRRIAERENEKLFKAIEKRIKLAIRAARRRGPLVATERNQTVQQRLNVVSRITRNRLNQEAGEIYDEVLELAKQERDRQEAMLIAVLGVKIKHITDAEVERLVDRHFNGAMLGQWLRHLATQTDEKIRRKVQAGLSADEEDEVIAARVTDDRRSVFSETKAAIAAIASSATLSSVSRVQQAAWLKTDGQIDRYMWTAILDHRTCPTCMALDGKVFDVGRGPIPTAHLLCRCVAIPLLAGSEPPEVTSYSEWLTDQPESIQNDILGETKARLFRSGKFEIDEFVDNKGTPLSLDEMRGLDPDLMA